MLKRTQYDSVIRFDSARTITGRGYYWSAAYLVDGLLIDTGCAHSSDELVDALDNENLACVINTHMHEDHIGANGILQEKRKGLDILAHPLTLPILENPRKAQPLQLYRRVVWGWPKASKGKPVQDGEVIDTGQYCFQVIYTPGHSPDHLCLYEQKHGWFFSGDLFVGGRDRAIGEGSNIWQIIASLKHIVELPLSRLFPGCARVRDHPQNELVAKVEYLEATGEKVLELHQQGLSVIAIARSVFGGPMLIEYITF